MERLKDSNKIYPFARRCLVGLFWGFLIAFMLTICASADGLLVGNVKSEVFDYTEGTSTSINDMLISFDVMPSQQVPNESVLVWATNPSIVRTFDGQADINDKVWIGETEDMDGLRLRLILHQYVNNARKGLRMAVEVIQWDENEYNYTTENQSITIYGENGGTIQASINILPYLLNIQEDVAGEDMYSVGYQNGYNAGQNNPLPSVITKLKQTFFNMGKNSNIDYQTAYTDGYNDGATDRKTAIEVSGLNTPSGVLGIIMTPFNALYRATNNIFNGFYDNPVGAVILAVAGIAIAITCVVAVGKFFL